MKKILVTGGSGFLGSRLCHYYQKMNKGKMEVLAPSHQEMDVTRFELVKNYLLTHRPEAVFHCGGISDTEYVRKHPAESFLVNVEGTRNLAKITGEMGIPLIFTSSDYVYQGKTIAGKTYEECVDAFGEEEACPNHEYGRQKLEAEQACLENNTLSAALRLTWMYDLPGRTLPIKQNLLTNLLEAKAKNQPIHFARHEYRGITNVWEVVKKLESALKLPTGSYNFGCTNSLPTIETARLAAKTLGLPQGLVIEDEERYAGRPRNISMSIEKLRSCGIDFCSTMEGLERLEKEGQNKE